MVEVWRVGPWQGAQEVGWISFMLVGRYRKLIRVRWARELTFCDQ